LERLLDTWDRHGSTSGPTPWQIYDDDDDLLWTTSTFRKAITKYISPAYTSYNEYYKCPPMCLYRYMYMLELFDKTLYNSVGGMSLTNAAQVRNCFWHGLYGLSYFLTAQKACYLYAGSYTLSLKWKPRRIELCFPLFISGM
jgi:hypothetical protein